MKNKYYIQFAIAILFLSLFGAAVFAQPTEFTYQGKLLDNSLPPTANYDFQFRLYPDDNGTTAIVSEQHLGVVVTNGIFNVRLPLLGQYFTGGTRWIEINVKPAGSPDPYTVLTPRQQVLSTPYSIKSIGAGTADLAANALKLGGVSFNQYVLTTDDRMTDARDPLPFSGNYIQNGTSPQPSTNFNIGGTGTATIFNAGTQYNIGGQRVLTIAGNNNVFAGEGAGLLNGGNNNAFFGRRAGYINTGGNFNSFFGSNAGITNTAGDGNAFFGYQAGKSNSIGGDNAFFGVVAGEGNTEGLRNSFFGGGAGRLNTTANDNSFFGNAAGYSNETGAGNAFFGNGAGFKNRFGSSNTFIGQSAGGNLVTGNGNTFLGQNANASVESLTNATAIGANASVGTNNTMVLGTGAVTVQVPGNLNIAGLLTGNLPGGDGSYIQNRNAMQQTGNANFNISGNGTLGGTLSASTVSASIVNASDKVSAYNVVSDIGYTVTGAGGMYKNSSGDVVISSNTGFVQVESPNKLLVDLIVAGGLKMVGGDVDLGFSRVILHPQVASSFEIIDTPLCVTGNDHYVVFCEIPNSPTKTDVQSFNGGLNIVKRLRPISFGLKDDPSKLRDVGFAAEEINEIEPLLTKRDKKGEVGDVKYAQITTVLVNAVNEQQAQIEAQNKQIETQQKQIQAQQNLIDGLRQLVCSQNSNAEICKEQK